MRCLGKSVALAIILIFLTSLVALPLSTVKAQSNSIIVPDNYRSIQSAIDSASAGKIVYVRNGIYNESIRVEKPLSIIGEDPQNTIIIGTIHPPTPAISISADCSISGFTIKNADEGIIVSRDSHAVSPLYCKISNNILTKNGDGLIVEGNCIVDFSKNIVIENYVTGLSIFSNSGSISGNTVTGNGITGLNGGGIIVGSKNLTIDDNIISNNLHGGLLLSQGACIVFGNAIRDNQGFGLQFSDACNNSLVHDNCIENNSIGVELKNFAFVGQTAGSNNIVYRNNILDNSEAAFTNRKWAYDIGDYLPPANGTDIVCWDNGTMGNYWSDYTDSRVYVIDANNVDHHPLTQPVDISSQAPTLLSTLTMPIIIAVIALAFVIVFLLLYRRHRKTISQNKPNV